MVFVTQGGTRNQTPESSLTKKGSAFITSSGHWTEHVFMVWLCPYALLHPERNLGSSHIDLSRGWRFPLQLPPPTRR